MQLNLDEGGLAHLTLDPDEHLVVQIGGAELTLIGGRAGTPGAGALVQIVLPGDLADTPGAGLLVQIVLPAPTASLSCSRVPRREGGSVYTLRVVEDKSHES